MTFWSHSRFQGVHPTTVFMVFDICHKSNHDFILWLQEKRLIASHYKCPNCREHMTLTREKNIRDGYAWKCNAVGDSVVERNNHTVKKSIRRGTWFENTAFSLQEVLLLTYYWYREYPHRAVEYELQASSTRVILDWYNYCKGTCVDILLHQKTPIGGHGIKIEVYECKYWKRNRNDDSKYVSQTVVICGLERDSSNCFFAFAEDNTRKSMSNVLKEFVLPGTIVYTDMFKDTNTEQKMYADLTVKHGLTFRDMESGGVGNTTEGIWTMIKRQFPAAKRSKALFDGFIGEFMYRRILNEAQDGYLQFLNDITKVYTPTTSD